jgi:hypothetical protein
VKTVVLFLIWTDQNRCVGVVGAGQNFGNAIMAPLTMQEYANAKGQLMAMDTEPMFQHVAAANLPIARHYVMCDRLARNVATADPVLRIPAAGFPGLIR